MFSQCVDVSCRVLANYLLWRLVLGLVPEMTAKYQKERNEYRRVLQVSTGHFSLSFSHFLSSPSLGSRLVVFPSAFFMSITII